MFLACISDLGIVVTFVTLVDRGALLTTASAPLPIFTGVVAYLIAWVAPSPITAVPSNSPKV
jgi:hypothetical protein